MGALIEKEIDTLYQQALKGERRGKQVARIRRILAYLLKIIAAGGSLVVATGYFPHWNQPIGVTILVAVLLDSVTSNYKRLLSEVQAGYAYGFLYEKVSREHNRSLDPILRQIKEQVNVQAAMDAKDALEQKTHRELTDGIRAIRESLAAADLKALESLALDNERAAIQHGNN
jgi:hypothetical protein